jgi:hypothetical protein
MKCWVNKNNDYPTLNLLEFLYINGDIKILHMKKFDRMFVFLKESLLLMALYSSERCGDYTDLWQFEKKLYYIIIIIIILVTPLLI